ncbi:glycosyltransferase family 4 protein [Hanstruepera ponticola]|uniref:glycosyltransferase family 4 protein n=1 Tax=Hanstruepera ponticola TaxID=2042995 RepID=UPI001785052B|nr:glycosyltransferase family 1 protein [Hanstruepera ponticola]
MKVAVWLNEDIDKQVGGGFSYSDRLVELIDEKEFSKDLELIFLARKPLKAKYKKPVLILNSRSELKMPFFHKILIGFFSKINIFNNISVRLKNKHKKKVNAAEINELQINHVHVIYYLFQTMQSVQNFPFITTNWDLGHLSMYAFPEVSNDASFAKREKWYHTTFKKALAIFVESESGKREVTNYLNVNEARIFVTPIFPGKVIHLDLSFDIQTKILSKLGLKSQKYFFYPAQFWAHKNHYNLIQGFKLFSSIEKDVKLVLTGSDKGNLNYILSLIEKEELTNSVKYLGFVELDDMNTLYRNALALVMPTCLGPTNMPLLEARALDCPVLCSDIEGHKEQMGDGALYFNPLLSDDIYSAMIKITDADYRNALLARAHLELSSSVFEEKKSMNILDENLLEISNYRNCWNYIDEIEY